jgi:hypothetical protein
MSEWTPIGHRPPLPRIVDAPYTPAPEDPRPEHVRQQIEQMTEMMRRKSAEAIWGHVVQTAKGG